MLNRIVLAALILLPSSVAQTTYSYHGDHAEQTGRVGGTDEPPLWDLHLPQLT